MKELILHIGHSKTGTSYLQAMLANNADGLHRIDATYPPNHSFKKAKMGRITGGNGDLLFNGDIQITNCSKIIYSRETFFFELIDGELIAELVQNYELRVILYSRDVFAHSFSRWGQQVKRGGSIESVDAFLCRSPDGPYRTILDWFSLSRKLGFKIVFRNYSRSKCLKQLFLGDCFDNPMDFSDFKEPPNFVVNRSLSSVELEIQRVFNAIDGGRSRTYVSDQLAEKLPEKKPKEIRCKEDTYDHIKAKLHPVIEEINSIVPKAEMISFEAKNLVTSDDNMADTLDSEQLLVLSESISKRFGVPKRPPE